MSTLHVLLLFTFYFLPLVSNRFVFDFCVLIDQSRRLQLLLELKLI